MKRKKSLLISTIAMVILLVVALSTATFAWYSSQNQVTATGATLSTASTSDANIAIFWGDTGSGSSVTFGAATGIKPMMPTTNPDGNTSGVLAFNEGILKTGTNGAVVFKSVSPATPWTQVDSVVNSNTELNIQNKDTDTSRKVTVTPSITSITAAIVDGNTTPEAQQNELFNAVKGMLRVAIFAKPASAANYSLLGVYATTNAYWGVPVVDTAPTVLQTEEQKITTVAANGFAGFDVIGNEIANIKIYAWLEGKDLTAEHQLTSVTFDLTFNASNPSAVAP